MVTEENVGPLDQKVRVAVALVLLVLYFENFVTGLWGIFAFIASGLAIWTAMTKSCEPYTWFSFKTNKKTRKIPLKTAVLNLLAVSVVYAVIFLVKTYFA